MNRKRVVAAMSGGVDSSVAAALLCEQGFEVIGVTLRLWTPTPWKEGERFGGCCSPLDIADAKEVARQLKIPHYTFNMEEQFKEKVVDDFVSEYLDGKTPNPCVRCNSFIKFDLLLKTAVALEADGLATGHYARLEEKGGVCHLAKACDQTKDQSYFLYMLNQSQLSKLYFPVGALLKNEVRRSAERWNLATAKKTDSQDVCFLEGRSYHAFLDERAENKISAGRIKNRRGEILGEHRGLPYYTIGQREGLGISHPERLYVIEKDATSNDLIVGSESENSKSECRITNVSWCSGQPPPASVQAEVKIRYRSKPALAKISMVNEAEAVVQFDAPVSSITPGQSAVFYDGDYVLGGGVIL